MPDKEPKTEAYAVIATGGKQYRVKENDTIKVELLEGKEGDNVEIDSVLALSDGKTLKVGTPLLEKAKVSLTIMKNIRDKKVISFKKKRRKGFAVKKGHRQNLTVVKVSKIG